MTKDPTFQQLRCFCILSEELHFGRAAERLHITQPPLTRHIQNLELSIGVTLFKRSGRQVDLTPAGEAFLPEVRMVLSRLDRGVELAGQIMNGHSGEIVIGYVEPLGIEFLPRVLGPFRDLHPRHKLRLQEMHTLEQVQALSDGTIDLGLLRTPTSSIPELTFEEVWQDELVVAIAGNHRLARTTHTSIRLAELQEEAFVVYDPELGVGILSAVLAACTSAGFSPSVRNSADSTPMLLALVAASEGIAFVSNEIAKVPRPGVVFRRIEDYELASEVFMGWSRGSDSSAIRDLCQIIRRLTPPRPML